MRIHPFPVGLIEQHEMSVPPPPPQIMMNHMDSDECVIEISHVSHEGDSNATSSTPGSSVSSLSSDGGETLLADGSSTAGSPLSAASFSEWDPFLDRTFGEEYSNFSPVAQIPHQTDSPAGSTELDQWSRNSSTSASTRASPSGKSSIHLSVSDGPTPLNLPCAFSECPSPHPSCRNFLLCQGISLQAVAKSSHHVARSFFCFSSTSTVRVSFPYRELWNLATTRILEYPPFSEVIHWDEATGTKMVLEQPQILESYILMPVFGIPTLSAFKRKLYVRALLTNNFCPDPDLGLW